MLTVLGCCNYLNSYNSFGKEQLYSKLDNVRNPMLHLLWVNLKLQDSGFKVVFFKFSHSAPLILSCYLLLHSEHNSVILNST